jgi:uncharacterized lipoprotein YmbA
VNGYYLQFALAWLVSVSVGCSSAPVRYYTLTPPPARASPASQATLAIDLRVVRIPPQLNRSELVVRTGPTEVTLLENERWASPVNNEIKDAVRLELQRRFSRMTGLGPTYTSLTLDIDVQHLEAELGRYAQLEASWSAALSPSQRSTGARAINCTFRSGEKIPAGYAGMVEGYQREIAALADAIADVLTSPSSGIDSLCRQSIEGSADRSGSKDH